MLRHSHQVSLRRLDNLAFVKAFPAQLVNPNTREPSGRSPSTGWRATSQPGGVRRRLRLPRPKPFPTLWMWFDRVEEEGETLV